jgi:hypothetical protein
MASSWQADSGGGGSGGGNLGELNVMSMRLFGLPYQFTEYVDARYKEINKKIGSEFMNMFMTNAPIINILPGTPTFSDKYSESASDKFLSWVVDNFLTQKPKDNFEELRFYHFKPAANDYYLQVAACWKAAMRFFGFKPGEGGNGVEEGTDMYSTNWGKYRHDTETDINDGASSGNIWEDAKAVMLSIATKSPGPGNQPLIQFYIEPRPFSDTLSNDTSESQISSMVTKA